MLKIANRINLPLTETSGIDSYSQCQNKGHFKNYGKKITYQYNSKGFRDAEWPEDLSAVVWCLGDSFTVGIGQPYEETWPKILEKKISKRCLNLGEDGCSNDTIASRIKEISDLHKPKLIVVMWSYFFRRRVGGLDQQYDPNDFGYKADLKNFLYNFDCVNQLPTKIIHSAIPNCFFEDNTEYIMQKCVPKNEIIIYKQLDYARDYHHFDIKTSELVTDLITKKITDIDKSSK